MNNELKIKFEDIRAEAYAFSRAADKLNCCSPASIDSKYDWTPLYVNRVFAIELGLKALLNKYQIEYDKKKDGHNLKNLFDKLIQSKQDYIKTNTMQAMNRPLEEFDILLENHKMHFDILRYIFEHTTENINVNCLFISALYKNIIYLLTQESYFKVPVFASSG